MQILKIIKKNKLLILSLLLLLFIIYNSMTKKYETMNNNSNADKYVNKQVTEFNNNQDKFIKFINKYHNIALNESKPQKDKINTAIFDFADNNPDTMNKIDEILEEILSNIVNKKKYLKKTKNKMLEFLED